MMSRKTWLILGGLVILAVVAYFGYTKVYAPSIEPTPTPELTDVDTVIWASGEVMPEKWAELGFPISGQVVELNVEEGDAVKKGDVLAKLDSDELEDAVATAEAAVQVSEAELERMKTPARPAEIARAEGAIHSAEATRDTAIAQLAETEANLDRLLAGARPEEVDAASARMLKAEAALKKAQAEYDKIAWAKEVAETTEALNLENATLDYDIAKANYLTLLNGATPEEIEAARAAVSAAEASVNQAEAQVDMAEAELELLKEGATSEEIAVAEASVERAESELEAARTRLENAILHAPFDGIIGEVYTREGEQVFIEINKVMVIGDLSNLRVETTDLRETDIGKIEVGQSVEITFDALPDTILMGRVTHISPKARSEQGGVNYRTIIEFDEVDPRLRWGMTAYVNITVD